MLMTTLVRMPPQKKQQQQFSRLLGVFFFWGGGGLGGGGLKGNLDGVDGMAALFKESLCICAANCWFSHDVTKIQT